MWRHKKQIKQTKNRYEKLEKDKNKEHKNVLNGPQIHGWDPKSWSASWKCALRGNHSKAGQTERTPAKTEDIKNESKKSGQLWLLVLELKFLLIKEAKMK